MEKQLEGLRGHNSYNSGLVQYVLIALVVSIGSEDFFYGICQLRIFCRSEAFPELVSSIIIKKQVAPNRILTKHQDYFGRYFICLFSWYWKACVEGVTLPGPVVEVDARDEDGVSLTDRLPDAGHVAPSHQPWVRLLTSCYSALSYNGGSDKYCNISIYFKWIEISVCSISTPNILYYILWFLCGMNLVSPNFKRSYLMFSISPLSCDIISLEGSAEQKSNEASKRCLRHPWQPVKVRLMVKFECGKLGMCRHFY